jgi:hypothetical protein
MSTEVCDTWAPLIGFLGVASALVFASEFFGFVLFFVSSELVCIDLIHKLDSEYVAGFTMCMSSAVASQRAFTNQVLINICRRLIVCRIILLLRCQRSLSWGII